MIDNDLAKYFFEEAFEFIATMENSILELERDTSKRYHIDEIFRGVHTIKSSSASMGMNEIASYTHVFEDTMDFIRSKTDVDLTSEVVDIILEGIDVLKKMLEARSTDNVYSNSTEKIKSKLKAVSTILGYDEKQTESSKKVDRIAVLNDIHLDSREFIEINNQKKPSEKIYKAFVYFSNDDPMASVGPLQVFSSIRDIGTILKLNPDINTLNSSGFIEQVAYLFRSEKSEEEVTRFIDIADIVKQIRLKKVDKESEIDETSDKQINQEKMENSAIRNAIKTKQSDAVKKVSKKGDTLSSYADFGNKLKASTIIRVDSEKIDELLNLVSQIVINKAALLEFSSGIASMTSSFERQKIDIQRALSYFFTVQSGKQTQITIEPEMVSSIILLFTSMMENTSNLRDIVNNLGNELQIYSRTVNFLQESVMEMRLVPIDQVFNRFPRIIRDLSHKLNKEVELILEGEDTKLDKSIIEELADPLMHILRNSMDHGIESIDERQKAGKPVKGILKVSADNEGNVITISVEDDGAGINPEEIRKKAIEKKLINQDQMLNNSDLYSFLFLPGFSTAKQISDISGRGVGLDIVRKALETLNGTITIDSIVGKGTKFTIKLPLTLAIIQTLMINVSNETYVIPINAILETKRIHISEIMKVEEIDAIKIRDEVISVLFLNKFFNLPKIQQNFYYIVIAGTSESKIGLVVDFLIGGQDVVIKPLNMSVTKVPGVAGSAILGNGDIALIVDINQLIEYEKSLLHSHQLMEDLS